MTVMERVAGVLRLQPRAFEDIEADGGANGQALGIVVLSSLAAGVGGGFIGGPGGMVAEALGAVAGWVMWAGVTYVLGARLLPERDTRTDMGELLRVMGYSSAPTFFTIFSPIPVFGRAVPTIVSFWLLATTVLAVRQALDYRSTLRAFAVVIIGWLLFVAIRDLGVPWMLR